MLTTTPTYELLRERLDGAPSGMADDEFWAAVERLGSPIVEAGPRAGTSSVTFLWRDCPAHPLAGILVNITGITDADRHRGDLSAHVMKLLPGTDIWALTYVLPADLRATYQFLPSHQPIDPRDAARDGWNRLLAAGQPDQYNQRQYPASWNTRPASILELAQSTPDRWSTQRHESVPTGWLTQHVIPGPVGQEARRLWVHEPPCPEPPGGYDLLVLLDGQTWAGQLDVRHTLDNLLAEQRIGPTITVMLDSVDCQARARDFACSDEFTSYLTDDVLAWIRSRWAIGDSARCTIAGQNIGAMAAAYAGMQSPDSFGRVLSQSAPYWWHPDVGDTDVDPGMSEHPRAWFAEQVRPVASRAATFELQVGCQEWLLQEANLQVYEAMLRAGHSVGYHQFSGGHEFLCWQSALADGLIRLNQR